MNVSGGCCIARCGAYDDTKKERVMMKFRPIAPKPVSNGTGSVFGSSSSDSNSNKTSSGETTTYVQLGRGKRKYNTTKRQNNGGRKRMKTSPKQNNNKPTMLQIQPRDESSAVTTLSLLPESPTGEINTPTSRSAPMWLSFKGAANLDNNNNIQKNYFNNVRQPPRKVVGSGVTVERVMNTWESCEGLGRTDEECVRNMEWDTCPGFITDEGNMRVRWTNKAYKKMVFGDHETEDNCELVVWVGMQKKMPTRYPALTCRVRVQNTCSKESRVVLCDVWRTECGGFSWRLDIKTALSLGR